MKKLSAYVYDLRRVKQARYLLAVGKAAADDEAAVLYPACKLREYTLPRRVQPLTEDAHLSAVGVSAEDKRDIAVF